MTHSHRGGVDPDHEHHAGDDQPHAHNLTLPSGEPNPYPAEDLSCSWCDGKRKHKASCFLKV
jgi:hypothetical protein